MKILFFAFLILVLVVGAVSAQEPATVEYNGIAFDFVPEAFGAVLPGYDVGTPFQTDAPYFANTAPHMTFRFLRPNTALPQITFTGELRVYRLAELETYGEPSYMEVVEQLQALDTATLADYVTASADFQAPHLPFMPVVNATQVFRAHPAALNVEAINGIEYYTYYSQAPEPILEGQVMYTYQGITSDGLYYVSFSMPVETGLLETAIAPDFNWDAFVGSYGDNLQQTFTTISTGDPAQFHPTLDELHQFIASLTFGG